VVAGGAQVRDAAPAAGAHDRGDEPARGHADILRESLDGEAGLRAGVSNLPDQDWAAYRERVETAAKEAAERA
jgi:hypothetical protein